MQMPAELPPPLSSNVRAWLLLYALGTSVLYAGSFTLVAPTPVVIRQALSVSAAAVLAWATLTTVLSTLTRGRIGPLSWLDAVLLATRVGMRVTLFGVLANLAIRRGAGGLYAYLVPIHLVVAAGANLAMIAVFARRARARGLEARRAIGLWLMFANGLFGFLYIASRWLF